MKKFNLTLGDIFIFVLSVLFTVGSIFVFDVCGAKADGSFMACHWAGRIATTIGSLMLILSIERFFVTSQVKIGLDSAEILLSVFLFLVPKILINLCKMNTMKCNSVSRPAIIVFSILIFVVSIINLILNIKKNKSDR